MSWSALFALFVIVFLFSWLIRSLYLKDKWKITTKKMPKGWKKILLKEVSFYYSLKKEDKQHFEFKIMEFLENVDITGINTEVKEDDRLLVAASAIIPIFPFKKWTYNNLDEVLLYPVQFSHDFDIGGEDANILGMVGTGFMNGKMILSKASLHHGFQNEKDKRNTAIHEFVHLIDKTDGSIDGIPENLLSKQYTIPWIEMIKQKTQEILDGDSDINEYATFDEGEFFAVVSEYFFERPKLLKSKHPNLYTMLLDIFDQDLSQVNLERQNQEIQRNDPCHCGSGEKYKFCCGKN